MPYTLNDAKELFLQAAELATPSDRTSFLDRACADNTDLRLRVEVLLKSYDDPGSFLDQPAVNFDCTKIIAGDSTDGEKDQEIKAARGEFLGDDPNRTTALDFLAPCQTAGRIGKLSYYEIIEVIGRGGMGIVLKGLDTKLNRIVAIKVLAPEVAASPMAKQRFLHEAQAAAAVSHVHLVTIHAVDDEHGIPFLVMECIVGMSLQQKIDREGALEVKEILRIGMQIASGLAAAHNQGLVHRDIKPANILLANGVQRVQITDFGLARAVDDVGLTQPGQVAGTPQYMSPEQASGEHIDHRSDLFSLGSVLYSLCTGRPAFRASSTVAVLRRVCDDTPRSIREINREIPQWLVAIIDKLLEKRPENRFQTAAELAALLEQHLRQLQHPSAAAAPETPATTAALAITKPSRSSPPVNHGGRFRWLLIGGLAVVIFLSVIVIKITDKDGTVTELIVPEGSKVEITTDATASTPDDDKASLAVAPFDEKRARAQQNAWAKQFGMPAEITNTIGMNLRMIPPGEFRMGSADSDKQARPFEQPQHVVRITNPFYAGMHEVTVAQFRAFVEATGHQTDAEQDGAGSGYFIDLPVKGRNPNWTWREPGFNQIDNQPICCVSWRDAEQFCAWLSSKEGKQYRLPTEAEWEYACRAGTTTSYHFGADLDLTKLSINTKTGSSPVGSFAPNAFGLHDMHGNVYEWCLDGRRRYGSDRAEDPVGPVEPNSLRIARGGGWRSSLISGAERAAARFVTTAPDRPFNGLGFRVLLVLDPPGKRSVAAAPFVPSPKTPQYALRFTEMDDEEERVELPLLDLLATDDFTVEANVRFNGNDGPLIGNGVVQLQVLDNSWRLFTQGPDKVFSAADPAPAKDYGGRSLHVAGVRAGNQLRLFIDGKLTARYELGEKTLAQFSNAWKIGGKEIEATVSEVCISKSARYAANFPPQKRFDADSKTIALYHFDEGQGDQLTDSSGNGNHGKIIGAKWVQFDGSPINQPLVKAPPTND